MLSSTTPEPAVVPVSQLTRRIKALLENEVGAVWVSGELSNWKVSPAGHAYFTLKDDQSQIDGVMFRGRMTRLRFRPENGLEVIINGTVTVYEKRGNYQIVCDEMQPKGLGTLQLAFEKLKARLQAEGLFDEAHKKPLPMVPRRIGIVTSPTGAAIRDILNVLRRRFANAQVVLYPTRVQGDGAAAEIAAGIRALDGWGVDVMIVGRGGGSLEDLWPFNEEVAVRAVFEAKTPIVSAVGHEIDFSLCDFAADVRAPTPSAAAELVVREHRELCERVGNLRERSAKALQRQLDGLRHRLAVAERSYVFRRPEELVRQRRQQADDLRARLEEAMTGAVVEQRQRVQRATRSLALLSPSQQVHRAHERLASLRGRLLHAGRGVGERGRHQLQPLTGRLNALSPLAILGRGYALARHRATGALVRSAEELAPGEELYLQFGRGAARATVTETEDEAHGAA